MVDADPHVVVQRAGSLEQPAGSSLNGHGMGRGDVVAIYADRSAGLASGAAGCAQGRRGVHMSGCDVSGRSRGGLPAGGAATSVHPPRRCRPRARGHRRAPDAIGGPLTVTWPARAGVATAAWSVGPTEAPVLDIGPDRPRLRGVHVGLDGRPQAIAGTHGPLAHFFEWHRRTSGLGEGTASPRCRGWPTIHCSGTCWAPSGWAPPCACRIPHGWERRGTWSAGCRNSASAWRT